MKSCVISACIFFFQAEDGIRDADVTGVQTCAFRSALVGFDDEPHRSRQERCHPGYPGRQRPAGRIRSIPRSEERRVGKECRSRWSPDQRKEKAEKNVTLTTRKERRRATRIGNGFAE